MLTCPVYSTYDLTIIFNIFYSFMYNNFFKLYCLYWMINLFISLSCISKIVHIYHMFEYLKEVRNPKI